MTRALTEGARFGTLLVTLVGALALAQLAVTGARYLGGGDLHDYIQGYAVGRQIQALGWEGLYDLDRQERFQRELIAATGQPRDALVAHPYVNPPLTALVLFLPLAALPSQVAVVVWSVANVLATGLSVLLVASFARSRAAAPASSPRIVLLLAAFTFLPLVWGLWVGQAVGVVVLLTALAFRSTLDGQDWRAGLWLALLLGVKPHLVLGPALVLALRRRGRALLSLVVFGSALGALSIALVGPQGVGDYRQLLGRMDHFFGDPTLGLKTWFMVNWRSWLVNLPGIDASTGVLLTLAAAVVTVGLAAHAWWGHSGGGDGASARAWLCCTSATLLASYHTNYQDAAVLLVPGLALLCLAHPDLPRSATGMARVIARGWPLTTGRDASPPWAGRLTTIGLALLLLPSLAWLALGIHALARLPLWAGIAVPALLLLVLGTRPGAEPPPRVASP